MSGPDVVQIVKEYKALSEPLSAVKRDHLAQALEKINVPFGTRRNVELYPHQVQALYDELCRLANYATLLGEPSPVERAGLDEGGGAA